MTCGECDVHGSIAIAVSMNVSKPSSYVRAMFSNLLFFCEFSYCRHICKLSYSIATITFSIDDV